MADPEGSFPVRSKIWSPLLWCLPSLLGFALFLVAFPIDRRIPFWPRWDLAEIFTLWFLLITPVATLIAIVKLTKRKRRSCASPFAKSLAWGVIAVSLLVNAFVLFGMWAAYTF
jgi:hypothetical protein